MDWREVEVKCECGRVLHRLRVSGEFTPPEQKCEMCKLRATARYRHNLVKPEWGQKTMQRAIERRKKNRMKKVRIYGGSFRP
jgi:hypothetical protein